MGKLNLTGGKTTKVKSNLTHISMFHAEGIICNWTMDIRISTKIVQAANKLREQERLFGTASC